MVERLGIKKHLFSFQIIILGFVLVIFAGAVVLTLPVSSQSGQIGDSTNPDFIDSLGARQFP